MKKIYSLLFLFFFLSLQAQIVNIPDANFKAKLLEADVSNNIAKNHLGQSIKIDINNDDEIQNSEANLVYRLEIGQSEISSLEGINFFSNLYWIYCGNNYLTDLTDFEDMPNLLNLQCPDNHFTHLDLSMIPSLELLNIGGNLQMTSVNFDGLESLSNLLCSFNTSLETINFSPLTNLSYLEFSYNNVSDIDLSSNYYLSNVSIQGEFIRYINIKNGSSFLKLADFDSWDILDNTFYCVDPDDLQGFNFQYLPETSQISVFCDGYNGPNYNTIYGEIKLNSSNSGNCESNLLDDSFLKVKVSDGINDFYSFLNSGMYAVYTQEGNFSVSPELIENTNLFTINPTISNVVFEEANSSIETRNFCITPIGESEDVEIIISPVEPARPGFDATYSVFYRNKGNQTVSGAISFEFFGEKMDFVSSDVLPDAESENALTFDFQNLVPFESREIILTFNINAPTDTPPVNIGDWLSFRAEIEIPDDIFLQDNEFAFRQEVVGSFDPNDIACLQGESVAPEMIGEELHYRIRFENTGNFPAERVVVAMPINPEDYEVSSFQLLNTSHEVQARLVDNTAEFFFEEIDLGPNEEGDILFSIKSLESLQIGDSVMSYADIYFDYNYPITTNEAVTTFEIMNTEEVELNTVSIFPNPATTQFNISSEYKINSVEIYDVAGRLIQVSKLNSNQSSQNISQLPKGMYILKIQTEKGLVSYKLIKK